MGKIEDRCQQSAWDRRRTPIGETSTSEDIRAAFREHKIHEPEAFRVQPVKAEIITASEADLYRWYVARVDTQTPDKVDTDIRHKGVVTHHPKITKWQPVKHPKKGQPRKRAVTTSLFTGYVFAGFMRGTERTFGALRGVAGFHGFISASGAPIEVHAAKVEAIMSDVEAGLYDETREKVSKVQMGQSVIIPSGPFAGMTGQVSRLKADERVVVLLDYLFGSARQVSVTVPVGDFG